MILDKPPIIFQDTNGSRKNMINSERRDTSEWKSWNNNIYSFWLYNRTNKGRTHLIYFTHLSIFQRKFYKSVVIIFYNNQSCIFSFLCKDMFCYISESCSKFNNSISFCDIYERYQSPYKIWRWSKSITKIRPKFMCPKLNIHTIFKKSIGSLLILFKNQVLMGTYMNYLIILRNSRISSISFSAIRSFLALDFSIAQRISSLIACPRALRTAESCWIISRTPASSSIIWMIPRSWPSIRRRRLLTRFFWSISLIFIHKKLGN